MRNFLRQISLALLFCSLLALPAISMAQTVVTGMVSDEKGGVMIGVTVTIKGAKGGTITDLDGKYSIKAAENATLVFSFMGYVTKEMPVAGKSQIDLKMEPNDLSISEVVVVGYGTMKKTDLTGSVTQVKVSDMNTSAASSVDNLLQGKGSGLQVLSSSGEPGAMSTIRIRGNNSFTNNNPLYVVDGVPMGDAGNLKQINPSDIESIDVLKDASATAIYGARGANGIIMVTTKKGKANKSVIEVSTSYSISSLPKPFDIINDPYLYAQLNNESRANAGQTPLYIGATQYGTYYPSLTEIQNGTWKYKTYWPDVVYKSAHTKNTSISARGGNDHTLYAVSLGYFSQPGMVLENNYDKYTGNFKLDQKLKDKLRIGVNMNLAYANKKNTSAAGSEGRSPVFPVYDEYGNYFNIGLNDYSNPVAKASKIKNVSKSFDLFTTGYIDWEIIKDLKFRSNVTAKYGESLSDYYEPSTYGDNGHANQGFGKIDNYQGTTLITDNYLTFSKTINSKNKFTLMVGTSYEGYVERKSGLQGTQFVNDFLENENLQAAGIKLITNSSYSTTLLSYYGRFNYNYDDRYLLTFTGRADGSSKFGDDNKFGYFPSVSLAWNVHNEKFFPKSKMISELKIRSSYGVTGNEAISPYQTLDRLGSNIYWMDGAWATGYGPGTVYYTDSQSSKYYDGLSNPQLKWESNTKFNLATDLSLWDSRLQITAEYYQTKVTDLLRRVDVPKSSGYDKQWQNDGEVSNKGYELSMNATVLRTKDLAVSLGFNISHNENKVVRYDYHTATVEGKTYVVPSGNRDVIEQFRDPLVYITNDEPMNFFYGYKTDGIVQTRAEGLAAGLTGTMANPGEFKYVDTNKNGIIDSYDRVKLGSPDPKFFYGFNANVSYKEFNLSAAFTGSYGNKIVNMQRLNQASSQMNRWSVDNPTNSYPALNANRGILFSDWWIEDGSYMKVRNIALSYNVNEKLLRWVKSCRLSLSVENVWTFTKFSGYDPEVGLDGLYWGSGYPRPRTYSASLNFTF